VFSIRKERTPSPLDDLIEDAYAALKGMDETTEAYTDALRNLEKLLEIRATEKKRTTPSPEAVLSAAASLTGIVLILAFEQKHVITTKSLSMIPRSK
jgi:hypothetical protein